VKKLNAIQIMCLPIVLKSAEAIVLVLTAVIVYCYLNSSNQY